jgi:hypothetical protein
VALSNPPDAVLDKLGRNHAWRCYANSFHLADGRSIPYLLWEGGASTVTEAGRSTAPMKSRFGLIAFSLRADDAGEEAIREMESQRLGRLGFWQRLKPANQRKRPCLAERLSDGTFVVEWQCPHIAPQVEERVGMVRALWGETSGARHGAQ